MTSLRTFTIIMLFAAGALSCSKKTPTLQERNSDSESSYAAKQSGNKPVKLTQLTNREIKAVLAASAWLDQEMSNIVNKKPTTEVTPEDFAKGSIGGGCFLYHRDFKPGLDAARYSNGGGDEIVVLIEEDRALISGFDHESHISPHGREDGIYMWPGMLAGAPADLVSILLKADRDESTPWQFRTLVMDECVTFALWREKSTDPFKPSKIISYPAKEDGGKAWLLDYRPTTADQFWQHCFEDYSGDVPVSKERVHEVFSICNGMF